MLQTMLTQRLGIQHPILCGGMTATGSAELASAVSNAGCLGMLTCLHCKTPDGLDKEIEKTRTMTDKPFAVNLTIMGEKRGAPEYPEGFVEVILKHKIKIVETCGGGVGLMSKLHEALRAGGVETIISKVVSVKSALVAQDKLGSDMVALMGADSGGLPGESDTGIFVNLALAKKTLRIPYIASGGVGHGRQILAALALGAVGVQLGTIFNATVECNVFPTEYKDAMVAAGDRATVVIMKTFKGSSRVFKNKAAEEYLRIESEKGKKLKFQDVAQIVMSSTQAEGFQKADPDIGVWNCGQSVALIDSVPSCAELVTRLINEANEAAQETMQMFNGLSAKL